MIAFDLLSHQGQSSEDTLLDEDHSTGTGSGVEDADFPEHPLTPSKPCPSMDDRLEEVLVTDRSGRSSSFGGPGELEGWSLVGYQDSQRQAASETVQPVGLADRTSETPPKIQGSEADGQHMGEWGSVPGCETPRAPSVSTSGEATRLADLLSRIGLTDDQIHKAVRAWLNEPIFDPGLAMKGQITRKPVIKQAVNQNHFSFWAENHHAPLSAGFGMPVVLYPQLGFPLVGLFLLGSPLPLFLTARGIRQLPCEYRLPQCAMFFNIFHPFDPVAYRMETLFDPNFQVSQSACLFGFVDYS